MPGKLMAYLGLVPSEHSFGAGIRRGGMLVHFIASFAWAKAASTPRSPPEYWC